jgi:imidazolonepropionase-like amidohydrolase
MYFIKVSTFILLTTALIQTALAVTVLEADGYVDVEAGIIVTPAVIVVDGEHIKAVNPEHRPDTAEITDLSGHILLPGLIDVHTHLTFEISGDWTNRSVRETAADTAYWGARNASRTLLAGFTTVRDLGSSEFVDVALGRAIEKGFVIGPRVIPAAHSLGITGGHCDTTGFAPDVLERDYRSGIADGVDGVTRAVRYQVKHGARVIKFCATAGVLSFEGPVGAQQYSAAEMRAIVEEAHRHGIRVAAHAHGTEGIKTAIRAGVDSVEHGSLADDEGRRLAVENGTAIVMNIYPKGQVDIENLPDGVREKARFVFPRRELNFTRAVEAGVRLPYGTDAGVYPHGNNANQFAVKVGLGQSPQDAIRSTSVWATELIGVTDRGRIRAGLLADMIAVDSNPLEDISILEDVSFVMKGGVVYKFQGQGVMPE